ncbi:MAG: slipin family protein, partial [Promethearchaeota archaeon]
MIFQGIENLWIVALIVMLLIIIAIWLLAGIKVILEYERLVIFRLGKYKRTIGPGVVYVLP